MSAGTYNFEIEQGTDFSETFTWNDGNGNPVVLTGYTASCWVRALSGNVIIDFAVNGTITVSQAATGNTVGQITFTLPDSFTAGLEFSTANYDLKLTGNGLKPRLLKGVVILSPQITIS